MPEKDFNVIFSKRLRYYLNKHNMTQLELSKRLGVGTTSVYNWCNGIKTPRMDKIDMMCDIFKCKRSDFMEEEPEENKEPDPNQLNARDKKNIDKILEQMRRQLTSQEGLMFDGDVPASPEAIESILDAMKIGMELAKKKNKKSF